MTLHRRKLNWLPISDVKYTIAVHSCYVTPLSIALDPPIIFGCQHLYATSCNDWFANLADYHLLRTMKYFQSSATAWWNDVTSKILFSPTMTHPELVNCVKSMYLNNDVLCV